MISTPDNRNLSPGGAVCGVQSHFQRSALNSLDPNSLHPFFPEKKAGPSKSVNFLLDSDSSDSENSHMEQNADAFPDSIEEMETCSQNSVFTTPSNKLRPPIPVVGIFLIIFA